MKDYYKFKILKLQYYIFSSIRVQLAYTHIIELKNDVSVIYSVVICIPKLFLLEISKSVQCDSSINKLSQSSDSLSVLNPIRTLQFLLKEIVELPNVQSKYNNLNQVIYAWIFIKYFY